MSETIVPEKTPEVVSDVEIKAEATVEPEAPKVEEAPKAEEVLEAAAEAEADLKSMKKSELAEFAAAKGIEVDAKLKKEEIVAAIEAAL